MIENNVIKRGGHILMLILWIESQARMLIMLKQNPDLLLNFKNSGDSMPIILALLNNNKTKGFTDTHKDFKKNFDYFVDACALLDKFWVIRDVLSHPQMSPDESFICNPKESSRKSKINIIKKLINKDFDARDVLQIQMKDEDYKELLSEIEKFDKDIFPTICEELSINYDAVRWPR